jgi:hypothetical protein
VTFFRRALLAVLVAGMVGAAVVPIQAATPVARAVVAPRISSLRLGCQPDAGAIEPDGTLNHVILNDTNLTGPFFRDFVSPIPGVTALGSTIYLMLPTQTWYFRTFTVRGGALTLETTSYPNVNPGAVRHVTRRISAGWGPFAKIVDASDRFPQYTKGGYLYGLIKTGVLARYKVTEATFGAPTVRLNGSRPGFGNFRSLALAYRYRPGSALAADVLIGTTSVGGLDLVTIPVAGVFAPRVTQLRPSGWTFDDLVMGGCNNNNYWLIGVRSNVDRANLYRVDTIAGRSSVIRTYGVIAAPWTPAHSSGIWEPGLYPIRG